MHFAFDFASELVTLFPIAFESYEGGIDLRQRKAIPATLAQFHWAEESAILCRKGKLDILTIRTEDTA
jgi:hypothetical protein